MASRTEVFIRQWRQIAGLTQEELARRAGVQRQAIILAEQGKTYPKDETLEAIAAALGIASKTLHKNPFKRFKAAQS